jgi:hypothetical protein
LKTAVSRTHLDVLQRDISIDIGNPMDVGLRHLTRLQKMGDVHPIDRGVLPGLTSSEVSTLNKEGGREAWSRHSLSAFWRLHMVFKFGNRLNNKVREFGFNDLAFSGSSSSVIS